MLTEAGQHPANFPIYDLCTESGSFSPRSAPAQPRAAGTAHGPVAPEAAAAPGGSSAGPGQQATPKRGAAAGAEGPSPALPREVAGEARGAPERRGRAAKGAPPRSCTPLPAGPQRFCPAAPSAPAAGGSPRCPPALALLMAAGGAGRSGGRGGTLPPGRGPRRPPPSRPWLSPTTCHAASLYRYGQGHVPSAARRAAPNSCEIPLLPEREGKGGKEAGGGK